MAPADARSDRRLYAAQPHDHACARQGQRSAAAFDADLRIVLLGDLRHDGQAQTGAVHVGPQRAVKRLKHELTLGRWDATWSPDVCTVLYMIEASPMAIVPASVSI